MLAYALMPDPPPSGGGTAGARLDRLAAIMRTLRSPEGCSWDREQTLASLRPFVIEEAYEVVDAIDREDLPALCEELGDLVFEAVFLAQLCAEDGHFTLADSLEAAAAKLIRRHPHVFGDDAESGALTPDEVKRRWEQIKATERGAAGKPPGLLGGIPPALPALLRAYRIGRRAATVGFDWDRPDAVLGKVREELAEVEAAVQRGRADAVEEELGDLLFAVANLARHLGVEPEGALAGANRKFSRRFTALEQHFLAAGRPLPDVPADEMDRAWNRIKQAETT